MTGEPRLRAFVLDDEPLAVKRLARLLETTGRVRVVGTSCQPQAALSDIAAARPDVLFLDIEMPGLNGFELLQRLHGTPAVVFTTAYDRYAVRAFDANSIDYLLKPIVRERLEQALDKVARNERGHDADGIRKALDDISRALTAARPAYLERIASTVGDRTQLIDVLRVSHFYAADKLTYASITPRAVLVDATLNELEERLDPRQFVRIHRASLVNLAFVAEVRNTLGRATITLKGPEATTLAIARERFGTIRQQLGL